MQMNELVGYIKIPKFYINHKADFYFMRLQMYMRDLRKYVFL